MIECEVLRRVWKNQCRPTGDAAPNLRTPPTPAAGYNVIFIQWVWVIETWLWAIRAYEIQRVNALAFLVATELIPVQEWSMYPSQQTFDHKIQFGSIK